VHRVGNAGESDVDVALNHDVVAVLDDDGGDDGSAYVYGIRDPGFRV
jgi:hypothetical protein